MATTREGSAAAEASNYLWTPDAADCAVDSDNRVDTTRYASVHSLCHAAGVEGCFVVTSSLAA